MDPMCTRQLVMSAMIAVLVLLLLYGSGRVHCATVPQNSSDMQALLDFKRTITSDPRDFFSSWNSSVDYCNWNGVTCSRKHTERVTMINLTGQSLGGQISPSLGNLTFLELLNLNSNSLFGNIPDLSRLRRLQGLFLGANNLEGPIPTEIGFLTKLEVLDLQSNSFSGEIPSSLGNISQLSILYLADNQLEGSIPTELGQLSMMFRLFLGGNRLSASIPSTILNHSSLGYLDVNTNFLSMALPSTIGDTLPGLIGLGLNQNMFHGQIPDSLGNASKLEVINLSSNNFTGQVPSSLGNLSLLQSLILDDNKLEAKDSKSWEFLDALGNCSQLQVLGIYDNQLQGAIPNSVGKLSPSLQFLGLDKNNLSGTVPESIGNLTGLTTLFLGENNLVGPIGSSIGKLNNLAKLNLSYNNFNGPIPSSLGNFTQLLELYLQGNKFNGSIPVSLENIQRLSVPNLSSNNLQGPIPKELFSKSTTTTCILSNNSLQGSIPPEVSNLQQLNELHLSSNKFTGEIPPSLGQCRELVILEMDNNSLIGNISFLSSLTSLSILNLSHNNLSGSIPIDLGKISSLTQVDLSYNYLQGEVPRDGVFGNATAISLVGNKGLWGGMLDLHMATRVGARNNLFKTLIPIFGFMTLIMLAYIIFHGKKTTSGRPYLLQFSFGKQFPKVSYNDLVQATGNFCESNLIGRGSYGSVYKGKIPPLAKMQVAIKVFDLGMRCADRSFISECEVLQRIRHRNLLPILTACSTIDNNGNDFKALIYVFMQNGNLDIWLHHRPSSVPSKRLGLIERINIAVSTADALAYLHHDCERPIVHCDLKPTNILLDGDMNAHLGDFGIASLVLDPRSTAGGHSGFSSSVAVTGTIGYIAPEYGQSVHASTCGDVYSFGIVLLEMVIGKRPTDPMFENEPHIVSFVESNFQDKILG